MPQRKKNEIRIVVIAVIALMVFLLIRRENHFTHRHPPALYPMTILISRPAVLMQLRASLNDRETIFHHGQQRGQDPAERRYQRGI